MNKWLPVVIALAVVTPSVAQAQSRRSTRPDPTPVYEPYVYTPYRYTPPPVPTYPVYVPYAPIQPVKPTSGSTYDWRSGNRYSWDRDTSGTTTVRGSNLNTGSLWRTTIQPDGSQRGTDSQGNLWTVSSSGTYMNYGTGVICIGTGAARVCS